MLRRTSLYQLLSAFFGLSLEHRKALFDQIHQIVFNGQGGYSFTEVYEMPIWLRKYTFSQLKEHYESQNKKDDVDYTDSDVLTKPGKIKYPDWALDPETNRDINSRYKVSNRQFRGTDDVVEDEDGLPSGRMRKDPYDYRYDTSLKSSRNFRNSGYHDEFDTEKKHEYAKKNRPSVDELIRAKDRKHSEIPTFKSRRGKDEEDDYLDNRLNRDYKRRERQFELPYEKSYNRGATKGYSSGATCNNKSYDTDGNPPEEDECCEGFSALI